MITLNYFYSNLYSQNIFSWNGLFLQPARSSMQINDAKIRCHGHVFFTALVKDAMVQRITNSKIKKSKRWDVFFHCSGMCVVRFSLHKFLLKNFAISIHVGFLSKIFVAFYIFPFVWNVCSWDNWSANKKYLLLALVHIMLHNINFITYM